MFAKSACAMATIIPTKKPQAVAAMTIIPVLERALIRAERPGRHLDQCSLFCLVKFGDLELSSKMSKMSRIFNIAQFAHVLQTRLGNLPLWHH